MSARAITISASTTGTLLCCTDAGQTGVMIGVTAGSSLGGGTLTIVARPSRSATTFNVAVDTMVAGDKWEYVVGAGMEVYAVLTGATSPTVNISAAPTT